MHQLLRLIVEAETVEDAISTAETYAETIVEEGTYDYYTMESRHWETPEPAKLKSEEGMALVREGMDYSRAEFDRAMAHVRYMAENYTDDQIYEEDFGGREEMNRLRDTNPAISYLSRYQFLIASGGSTSCHVYGEGDVWGGRVENEKDLNNILTSEKVEDYWVVPVDFHS